MKKRKRLIWSGLLAILVVAGLLWVSGWLSGEPTYRGQTAVDWAMAADSDPQDAAARTALEHLLPAAVPYYANALKRGDSPRQRTYRRLFAILPGFLAERLTEPPQREARQLEAALALKTLGSAARAAGPALIERFTDADLGIRQCSVEAVGEIRPSPEIAVPPLISALRDSFGGVRRAAAEALANYGPEANASIPALTEATQESDAAVCACAAWALCQVAGQTNTALQVLARTLKDRNTTARALSALYLGRIGPQARAMTPALIEALKDSKEVFEQAREALKLIGSAAPARPGVK